MIIARTVGHVRKLMVESPETEDTNVKSRRGMCLSEALGCACVMIKVTLRLKRAPRPLSRSWQKQLQKGCSGVLAEVLSSFKAKKRKASPPKGSSTNQVKTTLVAELHLAWSRTLCYHVCIKSTV